MICECVYGDGYVRWVIDCGVGFGDGFVGFFGYDG